MFIDTHCHLDFDQFNEDREMVLDRAREAGITQFIIPAVSLENCAAVIDMAEQHTDVYCAVGVHPNYTAYWQPAYIDVIRHYANHPKVVAIGEIGLDYHWDKSPKEKQHQAFVDQMALADELTLPIIVHNREATDDCLQLMKASPLSAKERPGVMHSFSADKQAAVTLIKMGFYLGFTGPITYKKAEQTREAAQQIPLSHILIETDAPYLSPVPYRGKRNEPTNVTEIAEKLAQLHGTTIDEIGRISSQNAHRLFQFG